MSAARPLPVPHLRLACTTLRAAPDLSPAAVAARLRAAGMDASEEDAAALVRLLRKLARSPLAA